MLSSASVFFCHPKYGTVVAVANVVVAVVARNRRRVVDMRSPFKKTLKKHCENETSNRISLVDTTPPNTLT
jgi:hypothetical protein